jgi:hypothetical protein
MNKIRREFFLIIQLTIITQIMEVITQILLRFQQGVALVFLTHLLIKLGAVINEIKMDFISIKRTSEAPSPSKFNFLKKINGNLTFKHHHEKV